MTRYDRHRDALHRQIRRLRFGQDAMVLGVLARIADRIGMPAWPLRLTAGVALLFHPVITIAAYVLAAVLIARGRLLRGRP